MSSEVLRPACQLAFAVARDGGEANDPIDPPAAMRSFLYVEDLPRRALAAAQQVIEENSEFRHRVALHAEEDDVGRAGFLWLHRPTGWAQEFEALAQEADDGWGQLETSDPDPMLEAVYKGLTAEPIEIVPAQPPEPDDTIDRPDGDDNAVDPNAPGQDNPALDDAPMASVSPIGLSDLESSSIDDLQVSPQTASIDRYQPSSSSSSSSLGLAAVTNTEHADHLPSSQEGFEMASADSAAGDDDAGFEADALESELASLRGLVARLANERDTDPPETTTAEVDGHGAGGDEPVEEVVELASQAPGVASALVSPSEPPTDDDPGGLSADLDAAHHELYLTRADLTIARQEREEAQRLQSEALKRQVQLEKELATVRERKAELEGDLTTSQAKAITVEERFGRIEGQLTEVDREREVVRGQLETMSLERNQIRDERTALRTERNELKATLDDIVEKTGGADIVELVEDQRVTRSELDSTSRELARMITQTEQYDEQIKSFTTETTGLKSERIDLRSRLGEAETALEVTTTQYEALKIDAERMASELGALRAERDGLQTQLGELQFSLGEVLDEQVESRQRNDADRRLLNELRVEHDVLLSRLSDVEQSEQEAKNRAGLLAAERDELLEGRDELLEERGQLRVELSSASTDKTAALERLTEVESKVPPLETELQMERRQREELANRLLELDDLADRTAADRMSLVEERDGLASAIEALETERSDAEQFRRERDELATELAKARQDHEAAIGSAHNELEGAARTAEELASARAEVEGRVAELDDELAALRADLAEVEQERDQAKDGEAETAQVRADLEATTAELDEIRSSLDLAKQDLDEAKVAAQVKESELRTVLGARTADAAEIERLKTNLAESMVRADGEVQEQANALAVSEAEVESRDAELASLRTELEAVRSVMAESDDENVAELAAVRAELAEATAETERLRADLAEVRVDLASTTAELEARDERSDGGVTPPPVDGPPIPDLLVTPGVEDELDSTAAEVRSALRGPSVLDSIADGLPQDLVELDESDAAIDAEAAEPGAVDDIITTVDEVDEVVVEPIEEIDTLEVDGPVPEPVDDGDGQLGVEPLAVDADAFTDSISLDPGSLDPSDDELDEVSELIARKMSTFTPDELSSLGPSADGELDLAAELALAPADEAPPEELDDDETVGVSSAPPSILGDGQESFRPAERADLGVSRSGAPKRRRIEVPGDIIDDEVAAARFVVSSPDVVLLVDGDSVAQMGWPKLPVAQQRDALVTYLADLSANTGAAPDVVFDGRIGDGDSLPASRAVRIRLSTPPTPPTAALDELVDAYPEQWPIALVTDNVDLSSAAGERGAAVLNNGQLLDLFIAE